MIEVDEKGFSLAPGKEWSIFQLGTTVRLMEIEIDTQHFIGNYPNSIEIDGLAESVPSIDAIIDPETKHQKSKQWISILGRTKLKPNSRHVFREELWQKSVINMVRITIYPDGGISRVRMLGAPVNLE